MVKFQLSFLLAGKSYSSMKFTRSNEFHLYFIEKNNWDRRGLIKRDLREMVGN